MEERLYRSHGTPLIQSKANWSIAGDAPQNTTHDARSQMAVNVGDPSTTI